MVNNERHDDLSEKIFKMGNALLKEGTSKNDYTITNIGNFMILISGIIYDEKDVHLFSELCAMFSAKKVIETQEYDIFNDLKDIDDNEINKMYESIRESMSKPNENDLGFNLSDDDDDDDDDDKDL